MVSQESLCQVFFGMTIVAGGLQSRFFYHPRESGGLEKYRVHVFCLDFRLRGNDGYSGTLQFDCPADYRLSFCFVF